MNLKSFFWLFPFLSFIAGYYLLHSLYGVTTIDAPSIVGKNIIEAFHILSDHNLSPRLLAEKEDPDLPAGTILSQTPQAGSKIKSQQSVLCVISKKPDTVKAPHLVGKSLRHISVALDKQGVRNKIYYVHSTHPKNMCVGQYPAPEELLPNKKIITYLSSGNAKPVILPNFKHKPLNQITEFLEQYNITADITHYGSTTGQKLRGESIIIDQRPLAGSIITFNDDSPIHVQLQVK